MNNKLTIFWAVVPTTILIYIYLDLTNSLPNFLH